MENNKDIILTSDELRDIINITYLEEQLLLDEETLEELRARYEFNLNTHPISKLKNFSLYYDFDGEFERDFTQVKTTLNLYNDNYKDATITFNTSLEIGATGCKDMTIEYIPINELINYKVGGVLSNLNPLTLFNRKVAMRLFNNVKVVNNGINTSIEFNALVYKERYSHITQLSKEDLSHMKDLSIEYELSFFKAVINEMFKIDYIIEDNKLILGNEFNSTPQKHYDLSNLNINNFNSEIEIIMKDAIKNVTKDLINELNKN